MTYLVTTCKALSLWAYLRRMSIKCWPPSSFLPCDLLKTSFKITSACQGTSLYLCNTLNVSGMLSSGGKKRTSRTVVPCWRFFPSATLTVQVSVVEKRQVEVRPLLRSFAVKIRDERPIGWEEVSEALLNSKWKEYCLISL